MVSRARWVLAAEEDLRREPLLDGGVAVRPSGLCCLRGVRRELRRADIGSSSFAVLVAGERLGVLLPGFLLGTSSSLESGSGKRSWTSAEEERRRSLVVFFAGLGALSSEGLGTGDS